MIGLTWHPVDWRRDLVLVPRLQRVDDAQHFRGIAARRGRVGEDGPDGLLRVDDEDAADGEGNTLLVDVGGILVVQHVVQVCHLSILVADDGEAQVAAGYLVNIFDPAAVAVDGVGRETDQLDAALGKLGLELCECS